MKTPSREFRILKKATCQVSNFDSPGEKNIIALAIKMKMSPDEIRQWKYTDVDKILRLLEEQSKKKSLGQSIQEITEDE